MTGWFGLRRHLLFALSTVNADCDEDGNYLIFGEPIVVGLDPEEVLVPTGAMYTVGGRTCSVAALLNGTSYGIAVTVIS